MNFKNFFGLKVFTVKIPSDPAERERQVQKAKADLLDSALKDNPQCKKWLEELQKHDRWGCNSQPSLDIVIHTLGKLPVKDVKYPKDDSLELTFTRALKPSECYWLAAQFSPNNGGDIEKDLDKGSKSIALWWD